MHLTTALIVMVALPVLTPLRVPTSVLLVVQVLVAPNGLGTVASVPLGAADPPEVVTGTTTVVPEKGLSVCHFIVEAVHVFCATPNVSAKNHEPPEAIVASIASSLFCVTPSISSVVAGRGGADERR